MIQCILHYISFLFIPQVCLVLVVNQEQLDYLDLLGCQAIQDCLDQEEILGLMVSQALLVNKDHKVKEAKEVNLVNKVLKESRVCLATRDSKVSATVE